MKRMIGVALTAAILLVAVPGGAAQPRNVQLQFYLVTSDTGVGVLNCIVRSTGAGVSSTSVTLCRVTFSDGATFSAPPVTVPSKIATTARVFRHTDMPSVVCVGGKARYRDGTAISKVNCF